MKTPIVDSMLDAETAAALASAIQPMELTASSRDSMRERILRRAVRPAPGGTNTLRLDEGIWTKFTPGIRIKILNRDPATGTQTFLMAMEPGSVLPAHPHALDEHCLVVEGEAWIDDHVLRRGDWHVAHAGALHSEVSTRTGCLLLIRSEAHHAG